MNEQVEEVEDTQTIEAQTPKQEESAAKQPAPPKVPWAPSELALEASRIMRSLAETGDKKTLAFFVSEAVTCRQRGREVRDNAAGDVAGA